MESRFRRMDPKTIRILDMLEEKMADEKPISIKESPTTTWKSPLQHYTFRERAKYNKDYDKILHLILEALKKHNLQARVRSGFKPLEVTEGTIVMNAELRKYLAASILYKFWPPKSGEAPVLDQEVLASCSAMARDLAVVIEKCILDPESEIDSARKMYKFLHDYSPVGCHITSDDLSEGNNGLLWNYEEVKKALRDALNTHKMRASLGPSEEVRKKQEQPDIEMLDFLIYSVLARQFGSIINVPRIRQRTLDGCSTEALALKAKVEQWIGEYGYYKHWARLLAGYWPPGIIYKEVSEIEKSLDVKGQLEFLNQKLDGLSTMVKEVSDNLRELEAEHYKS